jgi:hypothetical protein
MARKASRDVRERPPSWLAFVMRGKRAQRLGYIYAATQAEAIEEACREYGISEGWQKKRVYVVREAD